MNQPIYLNFPCNVSELKAGQTVYLSGTVYTARDAAHKRMLENGEPLPFDIKGSAIYYCGPTPARSGEVIGSCGPTTSSRMDDYTPALLDMGLRVTIGKGKRSRAVIDSMIKNGGVYLVAIGGAAALMKQCVISCEVVAYEDLGCEAVYKLQVKNMPLIVGIDSRGNSVLK